MSCRWVSTRVERQPHSFPRGAVEDGIAVSRSASPGADATTCEGSEKASEFSELLTRTVRLLAVGCSVEPGCSREALERDKAHILVVERLANGAVLFGLDNEPALIAMLCGDHKHR